MSSNGQPSASSSLQNVENTNSKYAKYNSKSSHDDYLKQETRIAMCVYTTNAGETVRAVEIARAITLLFHRKQHDEQPQKQQQQHRINDNSNAMDAASSPLVAATNNSLVLRFFTYRGCLPGGPKREIDYEHLIHDAGFDVEYFGSLEPSDQTKHAKNVACEPNIEGFSDHTKSDDNSAHGDTKMSSAILDDKMWRAFLEAERNHQGLFPPPYDKCATPYLRAIIQTLTDFRPNAVVFGLFPEVAVASAINHDWKRISFAIPTSCRDWMNTHLVSGEVAFHTDSTSKGGTRASHNPNTLPSAASNGIIKKGINSIRRNPWETIQKAAMECGLKLLSSTLDQSIVHAEFMEAIRPDHTVVGDFECFYQKEDLPQDITVVGPIILSSNSELHTTTGTANGTAAAAAITNATTDHKNYNKVLKDIEMFLYKKPSRPNNSPIKVLLTMGSNGESPQFLEVLKALYHSEPGTFRAVVLVPFGLYQSNNVVNAITSYAKSDADIFAVTNFVPTRPIMRWVDVVLSHGGQLTIQSALASGVPLVGTPNQLEQLFNLRNVVKCQAGVCILAEDWKEENIRNALLKVGKKRSVVEVGPYLYQYSCNMYKEGANKMKLEYEKNSTGGGGAERAANVIWNVANTRKQKRVVLEVCPYMYQYSFIPYKEASTKKQVHFENSSSSDGVKPMAEVNRGGSKGAQKQKPMAWHECINFIQ